MAQPQGGTGIYEFVDRGTNWAPQLLSTGGGFGAGITPDIAYPVCDTCPNCERDTRLCLLCTNAAGQPCGQMYFDVIHGRRRPPAGCPLNDIRSAENGDQNANQ